MIWIIILCLLIYLFMGWVGARAHVMHANENDYMEVNAFVTVFAIFVTLTGPFGWFVAWANATEQMARMHGLNGKGVSGNFARKLFKVEG